MKRQHTLCAVAAATVLAAWSPAAKADRGLTSVVRICAKNVGAIATCWVLQKGGEWVVDKAFSEVWTRIAGGDVPPAKPGAATPSAPAATASAGVPSSVRAEALSPDTLKELARVGRNVPAWLGQPGASGVVIYTPPGWTPRARTPAAQAALEERIRTQLLLPPRAQPKPAAPVTGLQPQTPPAAGPSDLHALIARNAKPGGSCQAEREDRLGLSFAAIMLAPPEQRAALMQRRQKDVLEACETKP